MSYSISVPPGPVETFLERFDETAARTIDGLADEFKDSSREAIAAARVALGALIESSAVVLPGQQCNGYASGHANPGHEPKEGWSDDHCSISLQQAKPPQVEPPPAAAARDA